MKKQIFYILIGIFLSGCVNTKLHLKTLPSDPKTKKLIKRFQKYWYHRTHNEFNQSWLFELPHYRFIEDIETYSILAGGYQNTNVKLIDINYIHPNIAIINRQVFFDNNSTFIKKDKWIYINNQWYHKFYQTLFPPKNKEEVLFQ